MRRPVIRDAHLSPDIEMLHDEIRGQSTEILAELAVAAAGGQMSPAVLREKVARVLSGERRGLEEIGLTLEPTGGTS